MRRVALTDSQDWKGSQIDKIFGEALYGSELCEDIEEDTIWFGSGRYFSLLFRFPDIPQEEIESLKERLDVMVNFDYKRVLVDEYQGCIHVRTQPMSLNYIKSRMQWDYIFRVFENWFDRQDELLVIRVDKRTAKGTEDVTISTFLSENWEEFLVLLERVDLQPASCNVSFIRRNLEFKLFRCVTQWEQLLAALRIVDFLCELGSTGGELNLKNLAERLEDAYVK